MKYNINGGSLGTITSPPSRGAWIEILGPVTIIFTFPLSPPSRGAWIEIGWITGTVSGLGESPPSRGAWIEIIRLVQILIISQSRPPRGGRGLK